MNRSPERGTFHSKCRINDAIAQGLDPDTDPSVLHALKTDQMWAESVAEREVDPEWQKNNLEYDLRSTKWICDKAKAREEYAQNIYAAMCNQDWQRNEVWPLLKGQVYSCSWRYAGGIVADMVETGDYIDWYCSGIRGGLSEQELSEMSDEDRNKYNWMQANFVGEGHVTDEIREDFFKLGWIPVDQVDYE